MGIGGDADMKQIAQLSISMPRHLAEYVQEKVKSGAYSSASEVVREALRRMHRDEESHTVRTAHPMADALLSYLTREQMEDIRERIRMGVVKLKDGGTKLGSGEFRG